MHRTIPMARGFESKSVESQQAEPLQPAKARKRVKWTREQIDAATRRESLELSRKRIMAELKTSRSDVHRSALENALKHLEDELRELG